MLNSLEIEPLIRIVGKNNVLTSLYDLDRYSADALHPFRAYGAEKSFDQLAQAVVRPGSTDEVSKIVVLANEQRTPLVPYGGGSGVMGGTVPIQGGIIVDMGRMNRILEVGATDLTARVEAGVLLADLSEALASHGMMHGHDPYSVAIATVAGTISTNGVGYRAAAFGPMGDQVVALEVVLPNGQVLNTRPVPMHSSGPGLNRLFIGSEGTFGIITQATIKIFRIPEAQAFATVSFDSFDAGFNAAAELLALGIHPTLLDLTEEDDGILLHLLFEGFAEGVAAQEQRSIQVCADFGGHHTGSEPTLAYWRDRHQSGENYKRTALGKPRQEGWDRTGWRGFDYLHLGLPISKVLEYRKRCDRIMEGTGVRTVEYAIWSRPELFSMLILCEEGTEAQSRERLGRVVEEVLTLAQDMGGVMEYCHGVGIKLNHLLARELGVGHEVIKKLKQALDPANIMNPGKLGM